MSKAKKVASAPSFAASAAKETTSSVVSIGVMVLIAIFVVIPLLPSLGEAAVQAAGKAALDGASRLPSYPAPAKRSGLDRDPTAATTIPAPKPYGAPNGPIKPLPSQAPPVALPPRGGLPTLEGGGTGGILSKIPEIGPAIEGGLKAIGPAAKAP